MPVYSRKYLRQTLGTNHVRDTFVGATTASIGYTPTDVQVVDFNAADLSASGQGRYQGAWLRIAGGDLRVASFNVGSGAYVSKEYGLYFPVGGAIASGTAYERHEVLPPLDKDRALDETIKRLWTRQEVGIDTIQDDHAYPLPANVVNVLDAYYFTTPTGTLDRVRQRLTRYDVVTTPTGVELRIDPALMASQQIVLDAIVATTLGSSDAATVNVPDERLVLFGAEAECWDLMVRRAPRGTADEYRRLRDEATRQFNLLSARFKTPVDRPIRLDSPGGRVF